MVSIIVTNYNYEKFLNRCLRSCVSQKNTNFEVIIIDDCSPVCPKPSIENFLDGEKVRFYKTEKNSGVAAASNLGLKMSRGQYVIRVDADDFVNDQMCFFMSTYLDYNHDAFCVSCDYYIVNNHEDILERKYAKKENISCGIMYRRDLLLELGGYNDKMRHREEEELRKRLGDFYNIHHLDIPFYRYRMHNDNKTKTKEYRQCKV